MNRKLSSHPATPKNDDLQLVLQENEYLRSIEMPEFSMENEQDIAEAARIIRADNAIFIAMSRHGNVKG